MAASAALWYSSLRFIVQQRALVLNSCATSDNLTFAFPVPITESETEHLHLLQMSATVASVNVDLVKYIST